MLPPVRIEPSTSDSKSNIPRFGQTWQVLLKFLFYVLPDFWTQMV